jgi:diacylglycerol kinase (ATP)
MVASLNPPRELSIRKKAVSSARNVAPHLWAIIHRRGVKMRTIVIFNPTAGASALAPQQEREGTASQHEETIVEGLRTYGLEPEVWYTTAEDPGSTLAKKAAAEGAIIVVAAGGDGTIHAVASGVIGTKSALGIIALGTMNNLAHSLSIPDTIEAACAIIAKGETKHIAISFISRQCL